MTAPRPGSPLPRLQLAMLDGGSHDPGEKTGQWQMLVIYRGRHCPRCKSYLSKLDGMREAFAERGVHIVIASADPLEKAQADVAEFAWKLPCAYGLSEADMQALGLYISDPSSPRETDRRFAEPGLFVVNPDGLLHVVGLSNAASCRPDLDIVLDGIRGIQTKNLPIRGMANAPAGA